MNIIDTAKELLRKGILLGDADLIKMANSLINKESEEMNVVTTSDKPEPKKRGRPKKVKEDVIVEPNDPFSEFIVNNNNKTQKSRPVQWSGNKWKDTGEIPDGYDPSKEQPIQKKNVNREKFQKVSVICRECSNPVKISPALNVTGFVCDQCIKKRMGR